VTCDAGRCGRRLHPSDIGLDLALPSARRSRRGKLPTKRSAREREAAEKDMLEAACREGERTSACRAHRWRSSVVPRPGAVGCGCRSRSASPKIWPVVPALAPLLHGGIAPQRESSHACTPSRLYPELYRLTTPSPPHCLPPPDVRGRSLSNSAAAMGSEEAPVELHGVRAVSSSMSLLPRLS
jgi:hypothetical protein